MIKFKAVNAYPKKESYQTNDLIFYLRAKEKARRGRK